MFTFDEGVLRNSEITALEPGDMFVRHDSAEQCIGVLFEKDEDGESYWFALSGRYAFILHDNASQYSKPSRIRVIQLPIRSRDLKLRIDLSSVDRKAEFEPGDLIITDKPRIVVATKEPGDFAAISLDDLSEAPVEQSSFVFKSWELVRESADRPLEVVARSQTPRRPASP